MATYRITDYDVTPNMTDLQTTKIQAVLDLCEKDGGTVVIPKGRFFTAALYMHSNTTLYLERGAELYGSDNCDDYKDVTVEFHESVTDNVPFTIGEHSNTTLIVQ